MELCPEDKSNKVCCITSFIMNLFLHSQFLSQNQIPNFWLNSRRKVEKYQVQHATSSRQCARQSLDFHDKFSGPSKILDFLTTTLPFSRPWKDLACLSKSSDFFKRCKLHSNAGKKAKP